MNITSEMPSPILLIGDHYICNKNIVASKKKYKGYEWKTFSASEDSPDAIRACAAERSFFPNPKIIVIRDLPNQKAIREFLLDLCKKSNSETRFLVWDSDSAIKIDQKTRTFNKTWGEWIESFKLINGSKFVNNGFAFTEKEEGDCISYIVELFKKYKRSISEDVAQAFMEIVGKERSYILSEIEKFCMSAPETITLDYVQINTYPSSKEAILYKFNNALDGDYESAVIALNHFLDNDVNSNVLGEIMMKKARWQLAAAYYYSRGIGLNDVSRKLMQMGKFPSVAWHNDKLSYDQKKSGSDAFDDTIKIQDFMVKRMGIPQDHFNEPKEKARAEVIPMDFMAIQMVNAMAKNVITPANKSLSTDRVRHLIFDKYLNQYLFISDRLKAIRYGSNPLQELYEMVVCFTDFTIKENELKKEDAFNGI